MKKLLVIISCLLGLLIPQIAYGQEEKELDLETIPTLYIADLDLDGRQDTITYDPENYELTFRLSSKEYFPESYSFYLVNDPPLETKEISVYEGGFSVRFLHMLAESLEEYQYEQAKGKFRLEYMDFSHSRFGSMRYHEKDRTFIGNWWFYKEDEGIIDLPEAILMVDQPLYWNDPENIVSMGTELFEEYCKVYEPERTEVLQFAGTEMDESDNNEDLYYFNSKGNKGRYGTVSCNYEQLEEGETIKVTTGTHFYVEPGSGRFHAANRIIEIIRVSL